MTKKFTDHFIHAAKAQGIGQLFFHIEEQEVHTLEVYKNKLEKSILSKGSSIYIEGEYKGKSGSAYTENLDIAVFPSLMESIKQTAEYGENLFTPKTLRAFPAPEEMVKKPDFSLLLEQLLEAEKEAYAYDRRVEDLRRCRFSSLFRKVVLKNEKGHAIEDQMRYFNAWMEIIAKDALQSQTAKTNILFSRGKVDLAELAKNTAAEAVAMLSASSPQSGIYPVILKNSVVCQLLSIFLPVFHADKIQASMSHLRGRLKQQIASPIFNLWENPTSEMGIFVRRFDDEGTPTQKKPLVEKGILATYLHNIKTAHRDAVPPTGNGFKRNYKESPVVASTNIVLQAGYSDLPQLTRSLKNGIMITDCDGVFAGANVFSGDFSILSKGFLIEKGELLRPLNQFTIGGNFFDLLQNIIDVGNDYSTTPQAENFVTAPSVAVKGLSISGK